MAAKKKSKTSKKEAKKAPTSKKTTIKNTSKAKTSSAKKRPAAKKAPVKKKAAAKKKTVSTKKAAVKKAPAKKKAAKKQATPARKSAQKRATIEKPTIRTGPSIAPRPSAHLFPVNAKPKAPSKSKKKVKPLSKKEIAVYKDLLLKLRDRVIDEISFLANDNLNRNAKESSGDLSSYSFHMADQGTDNYDREFAASLLNNEHDVLYEIEEALRRIEQGTYGICEISEQAIERERLKVIPFARYCVAVQSEIERGKPRHQPFRRSSIQGSDSSLS